MNFFNWVRGKVFGPPAAARDNYSATYGSGAAGGFAGAHVNRLTASLSTWSGAVNYDLDGGSIAILRARARQLAANNEYGRRFLSLCAANIVGNGETPKLQVRAYFAGKSGAKPSLDKPANDAIELAWWRWGRSAGVTGLNWQQVMRIAIKGVARDGEALVRIVRRRDLPGGISLQLLEADRLDETLNVTDSTRRIRQGVEVDDAGRPIAYWVKTSHPGDRYYAGADGIERIPAADIIHLFLPERAEQVRGYTWFHAILLRAHQLAGFNDSAVIAARIGASKIAALERTEDAPDATASMADGQVGGAFQINSEAGEIIELPPGYTLNGWNPEYPHANFESFVKAAMRGISAGLDVATHNLSGDMTDVNYSSARIAELAERDQWKQLQDWFIASFVERVYREWLALALLRADIVFNSGKALPADKLGKFLDASWFRGRRWKWVDPQKEIAAFKEGVALGVTSRTRLAAEQGDDFDDILDELKQEEEQLAAAGLAGSVPPAAPAPPKPAPGADDDDKALRSALLERLAAAPPAPQHISVPVTLAIESAQMNQVARDVAEGLAARGAELMDQIREDIAAMPIVIPPPEVTVNVAAPIVNVAAPQVEVAVEATLPAPEVELKLPARKTISDIKRDTAGDIVSVLQIESDM